MFKPFAPLNNSTHNREVLLSKIQALIDAEQYKEAEVTCEVLIQLSLGGLRYLQTYISFNTYRQFYLFSLIYFTKHFYSFYRYDWLMLRSIVTVGYLGWIFFSLKHTLKEYYLPNDSPGKKLNGRFDPKAKFVSYFNLQFNFINFIINFLSFLCIK